MVDTLRIAVVGATVPHERGTPAQREVAACRQGLQSFGKVDWFVVADASQMASRSVRQSDVSLLPLSKAKDNGAGCQSLLLKGQGPDDVGMQEGSGSLVLSRLLRGRRFDRLVLRILATKPDLLIIDDPKLAPIINTFRSRRIPLVLVDRNLAGIHEKLSADARTAAEISAHSLFAQWIRTNQDLAAGAFDQVWRDGFDPLTPHTGTANAWRIPHPALGRSEDALCVKQASVLVAATGITWVDRIIAGQLTESLTVLAARGAGPQIRLLGFDGGIAGRLGQGAVLDSSWSDLELNLVQACYLLVTAAAPGMGELIRTALLLGTPVLCPKSVARLHGVDGLTGVFAYENGTPLLDVLELGAMPSEDTQGYANIAAAAARAFGPAACGRAMEAALYAMLAPRRPIFRSPVRPARRMTITPFATPPTVSFHSGTRLLLVHVELRKSVGISEIRILDALGVEVTRILVNDDRSPTHVQIVEGGIVLEAGIEPGDITVDLYDRDMRLAGERVPAERISQLEAELASLRVTDMMIEGTFWSARKGEQRGWAVVHAGHQTRVSIGQSLVMQRLDLNVVPFKLMRTKASVPGTIVEIRQIEGDRRGIDALIQRPAVLSGLMVKLETGPGQIGRLKDIHRGKRAWMLGNGPSVRYDDLNAIPDDDITFAFNRFYKSYKDMRLRENYVISADTLMIADFGQEMIDMSSGLAIFCNNRRFSDLSGRFLTVRPLDNALPIFSYDAERFVSVGGSSVFVALQLAFYMGIREVFLYGMDFSFTMKLVRDPRFRFPVSFDDCNHFIKGYRDTKPWCPPNWRDITAGFVNARAAFEIDGGKILNATRGGKLELFERICFEKAAEG